MFQFLERASAFIFLEGNAVVLDTAENMEIPTSLKSTMTEPTTQREELLLYNEPQSRKMVRYLIRTEFIQSSILTR